MTNDGLLDYLVMFNSTYHCGRSGCMTYLFVDDKDNGFLKTQTPGTFSDGIGLTSKQQWVFSSMGGCRIWSLNGQTFEAKEVLDPCN